MASRIATARITTTLARTASAALVAAALVAGAACSTTPRSESSRKVLTADVDAFVVRLRELDPSLKTFFDNCVGYAAFPSIAKGGLIIGGAYGKGQYFTKSGRLEGYCDVTQGSIGAQIGGQAFGEIIFFQTKEAVTSFKGGQFAFSATVSAVAVKAGAGAAAKYENGVAVFLSNPEGLMLEASVGGQQFGYQSLADIE